MNIDSILQEISLYMSSDGRVCVAYSGGLDSTVLLHLVSRSHYSGRVVALHINHQLSPHADEWERHCADTAQAFGVKFESQKVIVENTGKGLEQGARKKRYLALSSRLSVNDLLLFGHHQNDVAETFIFRLMRGAGLTGLRTIPRVRSLGKGKLLRPLLDYSRAQLAEYAALNGLTWIDDESNEDTRFDRNFLRHELFPVLASRWRNAEEKIGQTVAHLSESSALLDEYGEQDLLACERKSERLGESISIESLADFSDARQKHAIRTWCQLSGYSLPDRAQLAKVVEVTQAREDANPRLQWGACELRRYGGRLYLLPRIEVSERQALPVVLNQRMNIGGSGEYVHCTTNASDEVGESLSLRFRSGQERCKPKGRPHSQTLKKLLQEYRLEPWFRDRVPMIYLGEELVAVGDIFVCDSSAHLPPDFSVIWGLSS